MSQYLDHTDRVLPALKERNRYREVEAVRLFTSSGHPWMGLAALVVYRLPLLAGAVYLVVRHPPF